MYPDSSENLNKETKNAVYFFTPAFYPLDNFSAHTVRIWGITFPTAEHAFQWKKFSVSHSKIAKSILAASSPDAVKKFPVGIKTKYQSSGIRSAWRLWSKYSKQKPNNMKMCARH